MDTAADMIIEPGRASYVTPDSGTVEPQSLLFGPLGQFRDWTM